MTHIACWPHQRLSRLCRLLRAVGVGVWPTPGPIIWQSERARAAVGVAATHRAGRAAGGPRSYVGAVGGPHVIVARPGIHAGADDVGLIVTRELRPCRLPTHPASQQEDEQELALRLTQVRHNQSGRCTKPASMHGRDARHPKSAAPAVQGQSMARCPKCGLALYEPP